VGAFRGKGLRKWADDENPTDGTFIGWQTFFEGIELFVTLWKSLKFHNFGIRYINVGMKQSNHLARYG